MSEPRALSMAEVRHHEDLPSGDYEFYLPAGQKLNIIKANSTVEGPALVKMNIKRVYDFDITALGKEVQL